MAASSDSLIAQTISGDFVLITRKAWDNLHDEHEEKLATLREFAGEGAGGQRTVKLDFLHAQRCRY